MTMQQQQQPAAWLLLRRCGRRLSLSLSTAVLLGVVGTLCVTLLISRRIPHSQLSEPDSMRMDSLHADRKAIERGVRLLVSQRKLSAPVTLPAAEPTTTSSSDDEDQQLCPLVPKCLLGRLPIYDVHNLTEALVAEYSAVGPGGRWQPRHCRARYKLTIIIPYRDRAHHLLRLLAHLLPVLKRQLLHFSVLVVEQLGTDLFNKGRLMNAAFEHITSRTREGDRPDCVVFHDVDLLPEYDRNYYGCVQSPTHLGAYVNTLNYSLDYYFLVGGVFLISPSHYRLVNGYSNVYWGWGGEDDDMGKRLMGANLSIARPPAAVAGFAMLSHKKSHRTARHMFMLADGILNVQLVGSAAERARTDGLSNRVWRVNSVSTRPLYTHLLVDVGRPPLHSKWRQYENRREIEITRPTTRRVFEI